MEVANIGWSASNRLLVHVSDAHDISSGGKGDTSDTGYVTARRTRHAAILRRLRKECGVQLYYLAYFNQSTQQLVEELRHECGKEAGSGWLVSEQLDAPEALPTKVAELLVDLLNTAGSSNQQTAAAAGAVEGGANEEAVLVQVPQRHKLLQPGRAWVPRPQRRVQNRSRRESHRSSLAASHASSTMGARPLRSSPMPELEARRSSRGSIYRSPKALSAASDAPGTSSGPLRKGNRAEGPGQGGEGAGGGLTPAGPSRAPSEAGSSPYKATELGWSPLETGPGRSSSRNSATGASSNGCTSRKHSGRVASGASTSRMAHAPVSGTAAIAVAGGSSSQGSCAHRSGLPLEGSGVASTSTDAIGAGGDHLPVTLGGVMERSGPFGSSQRIPVVQQTQKVIAPSSTSAVTPLLPWSARALKDFKAEMRAACFMLLDPADDPLTGRLDSVFALPPELWPVLPAGALYCLEAADPRATFQYMQHRSFPTTKVRLSTYFGKWGRHLVDFVVSWQPTPRAEAAWQLEGGKQPPLPWEQRQVVAHTTNGEYQYANTRMRFRGPKSTEPDSGLVEYCDAHGVDLLDTKAANETAPRNSDKDREAHLVDPPRPNTWGELARRPLISNLRSRGDLRTSCGRRVPSGYFFTLVPTALSIPPDGPGGPTRSRPSSAGRAFSAARQTCSLTSTTSSASAATAATATTSVAPSTTLAPKDRWRTYDVPFKHPIHSTRAQELGAQEARASGRGVRTFSDSAAVIKASTCVRQMVGLISEQELRLPRAFVPGPVVVPRWEDIPRLYAEHMEAARGLMPVTELDMYGSSKLHMLIYHLQCAATLEYDRLDAKLLLLPQMARLGCKSVEIDAWLQAIIEHASYLYDKLRIYDTSIWAVSEQSSKPWPLRSSLAAATTLLPPPPAATATAPGHREGWVFPDPLKDTAHASCSAVNAAAQPRPELREQRVPVQRVTQAEWSAVARVMRPTRHATLYTTWVRLRPLMTGMKTGGGGGGCGGGGGDGGASASHSHAGSMISAPSDAGATAAGLDDGMPTAVMYDPYSHGAVNREVLEYLPKDLEAMSSPDYVAPVPATGKKIKQRGYRGEGPLPPELVAEMPTVHRPVRCRGADETPLPPELQKMDLWNVKNKAEQASPRAPHPSGDTGAVRTSQVAVHRLQMAKEFAATRQAAVRKSMQLAKGVTPFDEPDAPYYGSDVAEDEDSWTDLISSRPATATQTADDLGQSTPEDAAHVRERERAAAEAAEARRRLLSNGPFKGREQVKLGKGLSRAAGLRGVATPISEPDNLRFLFMGEEPRDVTEAYQPPPLEHGHPEVLSNQWFKHTGSFSSTHAHTDNGPEPFSLEKLMRDPNDRGSDIDSGVDAIPLIDLPTAKGSIFGGPPIPGFLGLADYEMALARRRAIAGAEVVQMRTNVIPKQDVFNLLVVYCNLERYPEQLAILQEAISAPVSKTAITATARAIAARNTGVGPAAAAAAAAAATTAARQVDLEAEAERQRIKATAWVLGVTWRRITNETYTSFLCRVLGWPADVVVAMHRTRAAHLIARALVRGHDMGSVSKPPPPRER
ncbi:hypothetical protein VOLCADRAFT_92249 [Volvox carteri f. nagariensis]|uniref:Uncharacterized protein n=1 Tax=Volvox carteri f. nagariensis TaxID=3068 RepID=D8TZ57_VOLCA|nr:uncharacterized protein VOLCADRAFT_92249 [Volvox carteri f. nagariensis]EFJ47220.1 hypothetical protein VOLCADRAFT_92249 [Volvox carteri f. nagariensis]|eukprot:XP_002951769.1 hypothetical protein VOLCADRAFT_92249 [Volvox carteri f. nagariensis]